jgi:hypothetical protein
MGGDSARFAAAPVVAVRRFFAVLDFDQPFAQFGGANDFEFPVVRRPTISADVAAASASLVPAPTVRERVRGQVSHRSGSLSEHPNKMKTTSTDARNP